LPRHHSHRATKNQQRFHFTKYEGVPRRRQQDQLNGDRKVIDGNARSKDTAQRILRFARLELCTKMACKGRRIRRTEREGKIDIMRRSRCAPCRDRKPANESILIQEVPGFRVIETTHDLG